MPLDGYNKFVRAWLVGVLGGLVGCERGFQSCSVRVPRLFIFALLVAVYKREITPPECSKVSEQLPVG